MRRASVILVLVVLAGVSVAGEVGWRTDGTGRYPDATPPVTFSPESPVWAAPMPAWSNASPAVLADRIFVCAEPATLIAVDKATGAVLWQKTNPLAVPPTEVAKVKTHPHNGYTSATPTSDGERVFAVFGTGVVAAYGIDGKHLWSRLTEKPKHVWGHCASPLLVDGKLVVHVETLMALDPADGSVLWRQPAETWPPGLRPKRWGSPIATRIGDTDVIVSIAGNVLRAADGEILHPKVALCDYSSPFVADGVAYFLGKTKCRAVRLPATLDGEPEMLWETALVDKEIFFASPVVHDGLLYAVSQRGHFCAVEAGTGKLLYREKLLLADTEKNPYAAYSSVTLAGDALYFAGMDGSVVVVKPGREYVQLARIVVEPSLRSNPVFEGTRMYLRAPGKLYCFGR